MSCPTCLPIWCPLCCTSRMRGCPHLSFYSEFQLKAFCAGLSSFILTTQPKYLRWFRLTDCCNVFCWHFFPPDVDERLNYRVHLAYTSLNFHYIYVTLHITEPMVRYANCNKSFCTVAYYRSHCCRRWLQCCSDSRILVRFYGLCTASCFPGNFFPSHCHALSFLHING